MDLEENFNIFKDIIPNEIIQKINGEVVMLYLNEQHNNEKKESYMRNCEYCNEKMLDYYIIVGDQILYKIKFNKNTYIATTEMHPLSYIRSRHNYPQKIICADCIPRLHTCNNCYIVYFTYDKNAHICKDCINVELSKKNIEDNFNQFGNDTTYLFNKPKRSRFRPRR